MEISTGAGSRQALMARILSDRREFVGKWNQNGPGGRIIRIGGRPGSGRRCGGGALRGFIASLGSRASGGRRRTPELFEPLESRRLLAAAITVFDSAGFEAPRYAVRPLEGQDALGPWMKDTTRTG